MLRTQSVGAPSGLPHGSEEIKTTLEHDNSYGADSQPESYTDVGCGGNSPASINTPTNRRSTIGCADLDYAYGDTVYADARHNTDSRDLRALLLGHGTACTASNQSDIITSPIIARAVSFTPGRELQPIVGFSTKESVQPIHDLPQSRVDLRHNDHCGASDAPTPQPRHLGSSFQINSELEGHTRTHRLRSHPGPDVLTASTNKDRESNTEAERVPVLTAEAEGAESEKESERGIHTLKAACPRFPRPMGGNSSIDLRQLYRWSHSVTAWLNLESKISGDLFHLVMNSVDQNIDLSVATLSHHKAEEQLDGILGYEIQTSVDETLARYLGSGNSVTINGRLSGLRMAQVIRHNLDRHTPYSRARYVHALTRRRVVRDPKAVLNGFIEMAVAAG